MHFQKQGKVKEQTVCPFERYCIFKLLGKGKADYGGDIIPISEIHHGVHYSDLVSLSKAVEKKDKKGFQMFVEFCLSEDFYSQFLLY